MSASQQNSVLIIGGSGFVGSKAAQSLRKLHPDLAITIGGRDLHRAQKGAAVLGRADGLTIDITRRDLGLEASRKFSAIVIFLKDQTLNAMKYAQDHGIPYIDISTGVFELSPELARIVRAPGSAPILLGSQWLVGATSLAALELTREFETVAEIEIVGVLDDQDLGGPAAAADFERLLGATSKPLILEGGTWRFLESAEVTRKIKDRDGITIEALPYTPLDVPALAAATNAHSIRFGYVYGESSARRRGGTFATEVIVEMKGTLKDGSEGARRLDLFHPQGQAPVSALGVALLVERSLGLAGGAPVAPGVHFPDSVIEPPYAMRRFQEFGLEISRS